MALRVGAEHRARYATGQQESCAACLAAGVPRPRMGVSYRVAGDPRPLCLPCWDGEQRRAEHAQLWEHASVLDELREQMACQACGRHDSPASCWLCGYDWLAVARAQFEADQAAAARNAARQAELDDARLRALGAVTCAERQLAAVRAWRDRLAACLDQVDIDDGGTVTAGPQARAVFLLADFLARHHRARAEAGAVGGPGRPSKFPAVAAVMAVDADWRSGRRSMAGLERTAMLAGCGTAVVTRGWAHAVAVGWAHRTVAGGRCSRAERVATGRWNRRSVYDLRPLQRADPAAYLPRVPQALRVLAELLEYAGVLVDEHQALLADARAKADHAERAAGVQMPATPAQQGVAAADRRAQRTGQHTPTTAQTARDQAKHLSNKDDPHMVTKGENLSSCPYLGLFFSPGNQLTLTGPAGRPRRGRGTGQEHKRASRSSTERSGRGGWSGSLPAQRPRTDQWQSRPSRARRRAPAWAGWAFPLARTLRERWEFLYDVPLAQVAAVLGARLSQDWSADDLVRYVQAHVGVMVYERGRSHSPLRYLIALINRALNAAKPPLPCAAHTAASRAAAVNERAATAASMAARRVEWDRQAAVATAATGAGRAAARAALAAIAARRTAP
ncbi:hypothetical protein [Pilimelia columellifera]|uniref:Uncharacterized protein n=1 Tax=Pilimelia columellifera subsp. columellifera TaxID=706583 RepID=A0ABN3NSF9_9ACTN